LFKYIKDNLKITAIPIAKATYRALENTILIDNGNKDTNNDNSLVLIDVIGDDEFINYYFSSPQVFYLLLP
jgi:hypothetical protein